MSRAAAACAIGLGCAVDGDWGVGISLLRGCGSDGGGQVDPAHGPPATTGDGIGARPLPILAMPASTSP